MSSDTLKVVIPMAGLGTRLRPHTWSKPKQLVSVAGKAMLGHVLDMFDTLPDPERVELIFVVGYLGEHMRPFMEAHYPHRKVHYVVQENPKGQSHAIAMAREFLGGPMLMVFADTLLQADLSVLADEQAAGVAWVKPVEDPRRFGVAEVDDQGWVTRLVEKPESKENNLVVVGFYYFQRSEDLLAAIDEQMRRDMQFKGEYFLVDAINLMLEGGLRMRTEKVSGAWLDAGTPQALLDTNRYLLAHGMDNSASQPARTGVAIVPPVHIHPTADVQDSVVGPFASVGAGCRIAGSVVRNAILEEEAQVEGAVLEHSLVGRRAKVQGGASIINVGDDGSLSL